MKVQTSLNYVDTLTA